MNRLLKHVYVIFATLVLMAGAAFVAAKEPSAPPYFRIQNEYGQQDISIYDAQDGNYYVFLPSYANLDTVQAILPHDKIFYLDDIRLTDQMTCEVFELERPYYFAINGEGVAILWFYQSQNVATMYLDTVSGEMTDIHEDESYEEFASMTLYSTDGQIDHSDLRIKMKCRGNSTSDCDKRPYLLKLSSDGDLLGMGSAKKWVLLANAYDETNLNNKLTFDLASQVNFEWSPDCEFVELYLNGEYSGLYLLTEKVEVHPNRLDIDVASGDFLCMADLFNKREMLETYFESSMGRTIEVCSPKEPNASDLEYMTYLVWLMEKDFRSETDLKESEILDLDSWIRRYLIDEITGNIDSDLTSSYFYYSDGKFYGGPVWDYDMAFGNHYRNQEAKAFHAKNEYKRDVHSSPYYGNLYTNESFYQRMVEIYRTEFLPVLEKMIEQDIDAQLQSIRSAAQMNSIRWRSMFDLRRGRMLGLKVVQDAENLKPYLIRRVQFLNSAWLENREYCTVQFESEPGDAYWNISVEKGTCLETTYMDLVNTTWVDRDTGETVDFQQPILRDIIVQVKIEEEPEPEKPAVQTAAVQSNPVPKETAEPEMDPNVLMFGCFLALLLSLALADRIRRGK